MTTEFGDFGPSEGVVYKKTARKNIDLQEYEMICTHCNGWGEVYHRDDDCVFQCSRCLGYGKLDWVENVMGKKEYASTSLPHGINGTSFFATLIWGPSGQQGT